MKAKITILIKTLRVLIALGAFDGPLLAGFIIGLAKSLLI